jgi:hypothetical protein
MFGIIVSETFHRAFSLDGSVPNDSPVRHRTSKVSLEVVTFVVCVVSSPSHLRCRDFQSDARSSGADGTNAFASSSLNTHSISASHTTMAPRPARRCYLCQTWNESDDKVATLLVVGRRFIIFVVVLLGTPARG